MIRCCIPKDVNTVYELICLLEDKLFPIQDFKQLFYDKLHDPASFLYVLEQKEAILGFMSLSIHTQLHHCDRVALIEELILFPSFRGHGHGRQFIQTAIEVAKQYNCDVIELTSNQKRKQAHQFYEHLGFQNSSFKFKQNLK